MLRLLIALCLLLTIGSGTAEAARTWGAPERLGTGGWSVGEPVLTSGDELIALEKTDAGLAAAIQPPGGGSQSIVPLTAVAVADHALATGGGVTTAVWADAAGAVFAARRHDGGAFGAPQALGGSGEHSKVDVAASGTGEAVVDLLVDGRRHVAFSLPGGGWSAPQPAPKGSLVVTPGPEARFVEARGGEIVATTVRPSEPAGGERVLVSSGAPIGLSRPVADAGGRVAIPWADDVGESIDSNEPPLTPVRVTVWDGGDSIRTVDFGKGIFPSVAVNSKGQALVAFNGEYGPDPTSRQMYDATSAARLDLATGARGERFGPLHGSWITPGISETGDVIAASSQHEVFATRARPGGLLRATGTVGCLGNGAWAMFVTIDSRGQGVVVTQSQNGINVIRDQPADVWGATWCGVQPAVGFPHYHPWGEYRRADRRVWISMGAASDPEATRQNWRWDLDGDGTFEVDTGADPTVTKHFPAGRHPYGVELMLWFGDVSTERRTWRFEVDVYPPWTTASAPPPKPPQLTLARRSLRTALRRGLAATVRTPAAGMATVEARRRLPRGGHVLLGRRSRRLRADRAESLTLRFKASAKRRVRGVRALPIEVSLLQGGKRLARRRATLR